MTARAKLRELQRRMWEKSDLDLRVISEVSTWRESYERQREQVETQRGQGLSDEQADDALAVLARLLSMDEDYISAAQEPLLEAGWSFRLIQHFSRAIESAAGRLGMTLQGQPTIGTLPTGEVNAQAVDVGDPSTYLVLIDEGFFGFANLISKAVARCFPIVESEPGGRFSTDIELIFAEMRTAAALTVDRYIEALFAYVVVGHPHRAEQYLIDLQWNPLLATFRDSMELFVLAHEYAHFEAGHLATQSRPLRALPSSSGFEAILFAWQQEMEADELGLELCLEAMQHEGYALVQSAFGPLLFFRAAETIDLVRASLQHGSVDAGLDAVAADYAEQAVEKRATHPPPLARLQHLGGKSATLGVESSSMHVALDAVFDRFRDLTLVAAQRAIEAGVRPHEKWTQRFS